MTDAAAHQSQIPRAGGIGFQRVHVTLVKKRKGDGNKLNTVKPTERHVPHVDLQFLVKDSSKENTCDMQGAGENHEAEMKYRAFDELPLSMSIEDVMLILGIGRNTAYALVRSGKLRSIRIGRQLRITKEAMVAFLRGIE